MSRKTVLLILFLIATLSSGSNHTDYANYDDDDDYYYDHEEYDPNDYGPSRSIDECDYFYDMKEAGECHHDKLPQYNLQQQFGHTNIVTCCPDQGYIFFDNCQTRDTADSLACGAKGQTPTNLKHGLECPSNCRKYEVGRDNFNIEKNGTLVLIGHELETMNANVDDYCVSYQCFESEEKKWDIVALTCLCFDEDKVQESARSLSSTLPRCCPDSLLVSRTSEAALNSIGGSNAHGPLNQLTCLSGSDSTEANVERRSCDDGEFKLIDMDLMEIGMGADREESVAIKVMGNRPPIHLPLTSSRFCVGVQFSSSEKFYTPINTVHGTIFENKLLYCPLPCNGKTPCIRTCCHPDEKFTKDGQCKKFPHEMKQAFFNESSSVLTQLNLGKHIQHYLHQADSHHRHCPKGFERKPYLNPAERCADDFSLSVDNVSHEGLLTVNATGQVYNHDEFCLNLNEDETIAAEVCRTIFKRHKFEFYPYVMLLSCLFLLATLVIYMAYPKLLNHYTRVMRHFTFAFFIAFLTLSFNQLVAVGNWSQWLCKAFAFLEQYMFLVAFTLMTAMSAEVWMQINVRPSSEKRYRIEMLCGYLLPLFVTLSTLIVEIWAPRCASYRPRFGERHCFFTDPVSKAIWFFLPIGLMLCINGILFSMTVVTIWKTSTSKIDMRTSNKNKNENFEKFLMYLKLFLGMGFIWVFEISAGLAGDDIPDYAWYVTDILNMLQGFYVFGIFVLKRNVWKVIMSSKVGAVVTGSRRGQRIGSGAVAMRMLNKGHSTSGPSNVNTKITDSLMSSSQA